MMSGKGDKRRPKKVDNTTFDTNWEKTFNGRSEDKDETIEGDEGEGESIDITGSTQEARFVALGNGKFIRCDGEHWHNLARMLFGIYTGGHTS